MSVLGLLLWMIAHKLLNASASTCLIHDKCLDQLRWFTHVDDFQVYSSLKEAENACSEAKDAFLCVKSAPECRNSSESAKFSPLIRGTYRLLKEFCGYRSKRRPCCALRTAYLEHSSCYEDMQDRLNDCNSKYRKSLNVILTMHGEHEQNKQRFCSVKLLGDCVKTVTQSYCGKVAAEVIRIYVTTAKKPEKIFIEENKACHEILNAHKEKGVNFCGQKHFQRCQVHLLFLHEYLIEDRLTDYDKFLSVCTGIHDSLECLSQTFKRCLPSLPFQKKYENLMSNEVENGACVMKNSELQKYRRKMDCLTDNVKHLSLCQLEITVPSNAHSQSINHFRQYFCGSLKKLEKCWIKNVDSLCGDPGRRIITDIMDIAAANLHRMCGI